MGDVTDYVAGLDEPQRALVGRLLARVPDLLSLVEEGRSYGLPAYRYRGRPLVAVVAAAPGYTVYPFSSEVTASVLATLDGFDATKGGIRFTDDRPVPEQAFDALVRERRAEIDAALQRSRRPLAPPT